MLVKIEKQQELEKKLRDDLEQEIKKRSEYTRELVHELKTPITPILSSSELLLEGMTQEPWTRLAKNIYRGALDMNDRLDDLMDTARGEVGMLRLRNEPMNMLLIIRQMAEEMSPLVASRSQKFVLELLPSLPLVIGDETRMRQVLRNLLSNATKYTPETGIITLRTRLNTEEIIVEIQDTGQGIEPDQLERIFEPYVKITGGILERQTGLGLGLKLAKTLVELHGGRIWVSSEKGKGSIFSFSLPVKKEYPG
ncbi:MAG: HAMP domain-containing sensor histidine kinase [Dehalococcoidia bacterium]|nr:HAMP domain-containing sensor histidine kinase [Dehalococcoidia bacterium]